MLEHEAVPEDVKAKLKATYETLDIFKLKQELATLKSDIIKITWNRK